MLIEEIKGCNECGLRGKVRASFEKEHGKTNENIFYAFYYDEINLEQLKNAKFIFLMQNPGMWKNFNKPDFKELAKSDDKNFVEISRKHLFDWLKKENKNFTQKFLQVLKSNDLIEYDNWEKYIDDKFLNDFVVTDLVKCRSTTDMLDKVKSCYETCYEFYLQKELQNFAQNKLIFCFSTRTWDTLKCMLDILPVLKMKIEEGLKEDKVAQVHGYLFYNKKFNCHLIPLAHFSKRQFNNYLRKSYFEYLKEGVKFYAENIRKNNR